MVAVALALPRPQQAPTAEVAGEKNIDGRQGYGGIFST